MDRFSWRDPLIARVAGLLANPAEELHYGRDLNHDIDHHYAVEQLAVMIMHGQPVDADEEVIRAAAITHDIGYALGPFKEHVQHGISHAPKLLKEAGFPLEKIEAVVEVIRLHDYRRGMDVYVPTEVPEILLVQDADVLESMGARGIVRLAIWAGQKGIPFVNALGLVKFNHVPGRIQNTSFVQNYDDWQLPLIGQLSFPYSRQLAAPRLELEERFRQELHAELNEVFGEVIHSDMDR